ncbi:unnamed protein product [Parnassius apollo]|uniref:(apollo) hypothetical protein n=1 Tax=Parnassius apollo TaxID=110799 RepID=A0A8S3X4C6_PARAO|nr:unnamed protein product [Parnassius apollo]
MPLTRSQKDDPSRTGSCPSDKDTTGEMSGSEWVKCASVSASSGTTTTSDSNTSKGTTTTEVTTTTETTVATATTVASEKNRQKNEAAQKKTTKKTRENIPHKGFHGSTTTLSQRVSVAVPGP